MLNTVKASTKINSNLSELTALLDRLFTLAVELQETINAINNFEFKFEMKRWGVVKDGQAVDAHAVVWPAGQSGAGGVSRPG